MSLLRSTTQLPRHAPPSLSLGSLGHMTRARAIRILLVSARPILLTGCVATELSVTNHTDGSIQFYTGHTKKTAQIGAGATVTIQHTAGRVIIITHKDEVWEYDAIDVDAYSSSTSKGYKRQTLPLTVELGGNLTLPAGRTIEPTQKLKPKQ